MNKTKYNFCLFIHIINLVSSDKKNNNLIFSASFSLYVFISYEY